MNKIKLTKRDLLLFALGICSVFVFEVITNYEGLIEAFNQGQNEAKSHLFK
ncbi:hypothetical protein [Flammeovirga sp. SubArs3]|uniref:hypothetical protein n=1 Tax=Flammeovirga sp. SubArs3 TaxID=2995316 RepID=UPI00248AA5B9|nr:hypothetical protein [Flammeovirga sp. SubArs3]